MIRSGFTPTLHERKTAGGAGSLLAGGSESFGSPGVEQLRWLRPLRPGDELSCRVEVLEVSRSASGNTGSVRWEWQLSNQRTEQVLGMITTSLFDLR